MPTEEVYRKSGTGETPSHNWGCGVKTTNKSLLRKDFTLIELMVVVSIISILACLLLPAMQMVKERSRQLLCVNNLTQCGLASLLYAQDYQGDIHRYYFDGTVEKLWYEALIDNGYLADKNKNFILCPLWPPEKFSRYQTYGNRMDNIPSRYNKKSGAGNYIRLWSIAYPSDFIVLADTVSNSNGKQVYVIYLSDPAGALHLRHSGHANIWFADGSVKASSKNDIKESVLKELPGSTPIVVSDKSCTFISINP